MISTTKKFGLGSAILLTIFTFFVASKADAAYNLLNSHTYNASGSGTASGGNYAKFENIYLNDVEAQIFNGKTDATYTAWAGGGEVVYFVSCLNASFTDLVICVDDPTDHSIAGFATWNTSYPLQLLGNSVGAGPEVPRTNPYTPLPTAQTGKFDHFWTEAIWGGGINYNAVSTWDERRVSIDSFPAPPATVAVNATFPLTWTTDVSYLGTTQAVPFVSYGYNPYNPAFPTFNSQGVTISTTGPISCVPAGTVSGSGSATCTATAAGAATVTLEAWGPGNNNILTNVSNTLVDDYLGYVESPTIGGRHYSDTSTNGYQVDSATYSPQDGNSYGAMCAISGDCVLGQVQLSCLCISNPEAVTKPRIVTTTHNITVSGTPIPTDPTVSGIVWNDLNANGVQDGGEAGLAGETVFLTDQSGVTNLAPPTTTNGSGAYSFTTGMTDGQLARVAHTPAVGWAATTPQSINFTATGDKTFNFGTRFTTASITVNSTYPGGSGWVLAGSTCGTTEPGPATTRTYNNCLIDQSYTLTPNAIPNYNVNVSPAATQTLTNSGVTWTITYTVQSGGITAKTNNNSGAWEIRKASDNSLVRSSPTPSSTLDVFTLPVDNYTFTTVAITDWEEGVVVNGGSVQTTPRPFSVANGSSIDLEAYYSQPGPGDPSSIQLEVGPCEDLKFSWQDSSGTYPETGYRLSYKLNQSDADPGTFIANVGAVASGRGSYVWSNPPQQAVWIVVTAYIDYGATRLYSNAITAPVSFIPMACVPDLTSSSKQIYLVNNAAFDSTRTGKNGDTITFRITIQNSGADDLTIAAISPIIDTLMPNDAVVALIPPPSSPKPVCNNAIGIWLLCINKDADNNYNEAFETGSITGTAPNLQINISGMKCTQQNYNGCTNSDDRACPDSASPCNNWTIYFSAQIDMLEDINVKSEVWNEAQIQYQGRFSGLAGTESLASPHYLINTGKARIPQFREITP